MSQMRTVFGMRHGWEMRCILGKWFKRGDRSSWPWDNELRSTEWGSPATAEEVILWRALVRRDPKTFGVQKKARKRCA